MSKDDFENFGFGDLGPAESGMLGRPGAGAQGLAGTEAVEEEAPAGKKRKKEKKKKEKAPREERKERKPREPGDGEGIVARLGKASPYGVMLAASLGMILVAILCLLAELARYGFSIRVPT